MSNKPLFFIILLLSSFSIGCPYSSSPREAKINLSAGSVPCVRRDIIANDDPIERASAASPAFWNIICHNVEYECVKPYTARRAICTPQVILEKR